MKKTLRLLVILALVVLAGYLLVRANCGNVEASVCDRLAELCSGGDLPEAFDNCEEMVTKLHDAAGDETMDKLDSCLDDSESCVAAVGCVAAAGVSAAGGFMQGFQRGLKDE